MDQPVRGVGFCAVAIALYILAGVEPSPQATMLVFYAPSLAVVLWLYRDSRGRGIGAVHDWGFFLFLAWPVLLPWYAFRTRGRRGWRLLVALMAVAFAPWIVAMLVASVAPA